VTERSELTPPRGRAHVFVFVHEALPSLLFDDLDKFVDSLREPNAHMALVRFWERVGIVVIERGIGVALPSNGLTLESVDGEGWRGVVVHLPKVEELGDSALVLMMVPNPPLQDLWQFYEERGISLARLFMLKLLHHSSMERPGLKICELSQVLGHVMTGYTCEPNATDFVRKAVEGLDVE